jgi:hypothetical protein
MRFFSVPCVSVSSCLINSRNLRSLLLLALFMSVSACSEKGPCLQEYSSYDDAKDKLGVIVTAPTLFQRLAKRFQDVAREFGKLAEKQHSVVRMLTSPGRRIGPPPTRPPSDVVWCGDSKRPRRAETAFGR